MGFSFKGTANILCDNNIVIINSTMPNSVLKCKHNSFAYRMLREAHASVIAWVIKENTGTNIADMKQKLLANQSLESRLVSSYRNQDLV